jgi:cellulase/cellobiase CelA1
MAPSPPAYATNRYQALYRQRIPDVENKYKLPVIKQVTELEETCCVEKITTKKVPYIAKAKKTGKTINVIKYRSVKSSEWVTSMEEVV